MEEERATPIRTCQVIDQHAMFHCVQNVRSAPGVGTVTFRAADIVQQHYLTSNTAEAWETYHRAHSQPLHTAGGRKPIIPALAVVYGVHSVHTLTQNVRIN